MNTYKTYLGKTVTGKIISFRPLSSEQIKSLDDKSTVKTMELPGAGDVIAPRISEYYEVTLIDDTHHGFRAVLHANDIINSYAGQECIRHGYRLGSLRIFCKIESRWYDIMADNEGGCIVTDVEILVFNHLIGVLDINKKIIETRTELITMQRIPADPGNEFFEPSPEESDEKFAYRITRQSDYYKDLLKAQSEILLGFYHKI
jgi:hypothetical protein